MAKLIIIVDKAQDWAPFHQYDGVMSLPAYLKWSAKQTAGTGNQSLPPISLSWKWLLLFLIG